MKKRATKCLHTFECFLCSVDFASQNQIIFMFYSFASLSLPFALALAVRFVRFCSYFRWLCFFFIMHTSMIIVIWLTFSTSTKSKFHLKNGWAQENPDNSYDLINIYIVIGLINFKLPTAKYNIYVLLFCAALSCRLLFFNRNGIYVLLSNAWVQNSAFFAFYLNNCIYI